MFKKVKSVAEVLGSADKFVAELEEAVAAEALQAAEKNITVQELKTEIQELDMSVKRGEAVAENFKKMLNV